MLLAIQQGAFVTGMQLGEEQQSLLEAQQPSVLHPPSSSQHDVLARELHLELVSLQHDCFFEDDDFLLQQSSDFSVLQQSFLSSSRRTAPPPLQLEVPPQHPELLVDVDAIVRSL